MYFSIHKMEDLHTGCSLKEVLKSSFLNKLYFLASQICARVNNNTAVPHYFKNTLNFIV